MIDPRDLRTLRELLAWWRQNKTSVTAKNKTPPKQPKMVGGGVRLKIGKADGTIVAGDSGTVDVWRDQADTGEEITAELPSELTDQNISDGKGVAAAWFPDENEWKIIAAECEDSEPPDILESTNTSESQMLTTTFSDVAGLSVSYLSGSAIAAISIFGDVVDDSGNFVIDDSANQIIAEG